VVVLAVPYDAAVTVLREYGEVLSGKTVVDITNPVDWQTFDGLVTPGDSSAAEEIQKGAPEGVGLVKAWNTTFAGTLVAGNEAGAKEAVIGLVESAGSRAIDAGPLRRARELERLGFLGMTLQQPLGLNFQSAWKLISQATTR
jgi:predicted dinucleotide-binding enzyme